MRVIFTIFFLLNFIIGCVDKSIDLDTTGIKPVSSFIFNNTLIGTVVKSSDENSIGEKITFIDLSTSSPRISFSGTGVISSMKKLNETEYVIVLQLFTGESFDTFIINKSNGLFTRSYCRTSPGDELYSGCSIGYCM